MKILGINAVVVGVVATRAGAEPIIDRPLTVERGTVAVLAAVEVSQRTEAIGNLAASTTGEGVRFGVGYGVTDRVAVGIDATVGLHAVLSNRPLTASASVVLVHLPRLDVGASVAVTVDLDTSIPDAARDHLHVGFGARYRLGPSVAILAGGSGGELYQAPLGAGFGVGVPSSLGQQLHIGLRSGGSIAVDLPIGVAVQATPRLYVGGWTSIVHVGVAHDATTVEVPLEIAAMIAMTPRIDLGGFLDIPELVHPQRVMLAGVVARFFL